MQSTWGPRIFWGIVFVLVIAGVFAYFYEPQPEVGRFGGRVADNVLTVSPKLIGFELQVGLKDQVPTDWTGRVVLPGGKVTQIQPSARTPNWRWEGDQFHLTTHGAGNQAEPISLYIVAEPGEGQALHVVLGNETKSLPLAELPLGQTVELFEGKAALRRTAPIQMYGVEGPTADVAPRVAQDASGNAYLVYLACQKSKGIEANALLSGTFDTLERPITGGMLRLSQFDRDSWQYPEAVGGKLDGVLDPVVAVNPARRAFIAWSQPGPDGWDVYYTTKELTVGSAHLAWSVPVKVTDKPGAPQNLVAVVDAKGNVWLAWQTWHLDHFEIYASVLNDDRHPWARPAPVAEHGRDEEGRWNPALAADGQGNVFVAWSVFRGGHFDVGLARLNETASVGPPIFLAATERQEQRPALRCDGENNVWVAYEESEGDGAAGSFATPTYSRAKIRVRVIRPDLRVEDAPPVPRPLRRTEAGTRDNGPPACRRPRLLITKSGCPVLCFESQRRLYLSRLQDGGWSEPEEFVSLSSRAGSPAAVHYLNEHVCAFFEGADASGQSRLCLATLPESSSSIPAVTRTPVDPLAQDRKEDPGWKRFAEYARHFRQRPEDLVLFKKYLSRGLFLSEQGARELGDDPYGVVQAALEQGMYDWAVVTKPTRDPAALQWLLAERAQAISQGERRILTGYYRPMTGQPQANFVIEHKPLESPLPSLARLQSFLGESREGATVGSQATDQKLFSQFLTQTQNVGFLLTEDWRMLASLNKPVAGSAFTDATENAIIPFWYPAAEPGRPAPLGVRVVAYASGKTTEDLIEALRDRRFYIATDDIHLLVRCEQRTPGDVFQTSFKPKIHVVAQGTGKLAKVEIWQDDKLVKSEEPPGAASVLEFEYPNADATWHSYTVRVLQTDGAMAVTQPMWIRYTP